MTAPRKPGAAGWIDRDEVLARTDLAVLADQLIGPGRGRGRARTWRCPAPGHGPQTGRTPPVGVFKGRDGVQRWHCHGCGAGGTAVDLVTAARGLDFRAALALLAGQAAGGAVPPRQPSPASSRAGTPAATRSAPPPHPAPAARDEARRRRDELLRRTDLGAVLSRLLGPASTGGRAPAWPCPHPAHGPDPAPSIGLAPPAGHAARWRCGTCGAAGTAGTAGTAIDLVMLTQQREYPEAVRLLESLPQLAPPAPAAPAAAVRERAQPHPSVRRYIDQCERVLRSPRGLGAPALAELQRRGIPEPVLRANRLGYDPGPAVLPRGRGLPRAGPAIVLPVFDPGGRAVSFQARYLAPPDGIGKYANPPERLTGPAPRVAFPRLPGRPANPGVVLVCEGLFDALSAATAGYRSAAVLGAGQPDTAVVDALLQQFPHERLTVAFDPDEAGRRGAERIVELLSAAGAGDRTSRLEAPHGDLNDWLQRDPQFSRELGQAALRNAGLTPASGIDLHL